MGVGVGSSVGVGVGVGVGAGIGAGVGVGAGADGRVRVHALFLPVAVLSFIYLPTRSPTTPPHRHPQSVASYVHRVGRTGRAGGEGLAVTLACPEDEGIIQDIHEALG